MRGLPGELPPIPTIRALTEDRHRFIGGACLGLGVSDLIFLALAALHPGRRRLSVKVTFRERRSNGRVKFAERKEDLILHRLTTCLRGDSGI